MMRAADLFPQVPFGADPDDLRREMPSARTRPFPNYMRVKCIGAIDSNL
jgi:hypothetical protein